MMPTLPPGWDWSGRMAVGMGCTIEADNLDEVARGAWKTWHRVSGITPVEWERLNAATDKLAALERTVSRVAPRLWDEIRAGVHDR